MGAIEPRKAVGGLSVLADSEQSEESCWQTPPWLVSRVRAAMGGIELDPCTTPVNPVGAERFYAPPQDDGILNPWNAKTIYVNPPYGKTIKLWVRKSIDASLDGAAVVMLVPARPDPSWFQEAQRHASDIVFVRGRLKFVKPDGEPTKNSAHFPSALIGFNVDLSSLADLGFLHRRLKGAA